MTLYNLSLFLDENLRSKQTTNFMGKIQLFVDSGFVKTCNELVIDLEDEDPVQGEAYINRAAQLQTQTKDSRLQILYKVKHDFHYL